MLRLERDDLDPPTLIAAKASVAAHNVARARRIVNSVFIRNSCCVRVKWINVVILGHFICGVNTSIDKIGDWR